MQKQSDAPGKQDEPPQSRLSQAERRQMLRDWLAVCLLLIVCLLLMMWTASAPAECGPHSNLRTLLWPCD